MNWVRFLWRIALYKNDPLLLLLLLHSADLAGMTQSIPSIYIICNGMIENVESAMCWHVSIKWNVAFLFFRFLESVLLKTYGVIFMLSVPNGRTSSDHWKCSVCLTREDTHGMGFIASSDFNTDFSLQLSSFFFSSHYRHGFGLCSVVTLTGLHTVAVFYIGGGVKKKHSESTVDCCTKCWMEGNFLSVFVSVKENRSVWKTKETTQTFLLVFSKLGSESHFLLLWMHRLSF